MNEHPSHEPVTPRADAVTHVLAVDGGTLAYEVSGPAAAGRPLVVLAHGMGDDRRAYRFLAPRLVAAGYRVASVDLRGAGESSTGWASYSRTDIAGDLLALVAHLTADAPVPVVLVGHSIAGGAVTVAAADAPDVVTAVVELAPFTRKQSIGLREVSSRAYRRGATQLMATALLGSTRAWSRYLSLAYPGARPADWDERTAQVEAMLREPGRMKALQAMFRSAPTDAGARLADVTCPVLVVQGGDDPDWADPRAEGEAIVANLPAGLGRLEVVDGSGHYPHVQHAAETAALVLPFLASVVAARA
ncbi:MAG: alpha/beta hydrolase [Nocardioidaceae bacterium]|nr:alpha/beta hydrolase [Nocardioidaceae bacterium]